MTPKNEGFHHPSPDLNMAVSIFYIGSCLQLAICDTNGKREYSRGVLVRGIVLWLHESHRSDSIDLPRRLRRESTCPLRVACEVLFSRAAAVIDSARPAKDKFSSTACTDTLAAATQPHQGSATTTDQGSGKCAKRIAHRAQLRTQLAQKARTLLCVGPC